MLERIINTIDKQLSAYSSVKSSDLSIKIKDIRNNCNILCYRVALNDDELFSFVKNYLKYMECQKIFEINALEKYFDNMTINILKTAKRMNTPAIRFLQNKDDISLLEGFLL